MLADQLERLAQRSLQQAAVLEQLARQLDSLASRTEAVIGGTATGEDRLLLEHVATASAAAKKSAAAFREAVEHARKAASEARAEDVRKQQRAEASLR